MPATRLKFETALITVILFLSYGFLPSPADAQDSLPLFQAGMNSASFHLGLAEPAGTNNFDTAVRSGPDINLQFLHYSWDWIAYGFEVGYTLFGRRLQTDNTGLMFGISNAADLGFKAQDMHADILARINLMEDRPWTPYLLGGVGIHEFDGQADWAPAGAPAGTSRKTQHAFSRSMIATGATGVEGFLFQNVSLSFEARFRSMQLGSRFTTGTVESLSYLFGFRYWFGM